MKLKNNTLKKILCGLFLFFGAAVTSFAQDHNAMMKAANEAYQKQKFEEAAVLYQQIADAGNEGSVLYYNLGNAYFKCDENGKALLWYERALRLDPRNEDIKHNIAFVNQKLVDKIDIMPELFISRWWNALSSSLTSHSWAVCSIIASLLFFVCLAGMLLLKRPALHSVCTWCSLLCLLLLIFSIIFANKEKDRYLETPEAIVMSPVLNVKSTPGTASNDLFVIHEGLKVEVTDHLNEWVEIKLPNGDKGWVEAKAVEII